MRWQAYIMIQKLTDRHKEHRHKLSISNIASFNIEELLRYCIWWWKKWKGSWKSTWSVLFTVICIFWIWKFEFFWLYINLKNISSKVKLRDAMLNNRNLTILLRNLLNQAVFWSTLFSLIFTSISFNTIDILKLILFYYCESRGGVRMGKYITVI